MSKVVPGVMRHLTPEELVDLAEGLRPSSSARHLESCEACRRQLAELAAMMSVVAADEGSEPSPLYWDHLSSHVREAVAAEGAPRRGSWFGLSWWSRVALSFTAGTLAALVFASVVTMRVGSAREGAGGGAPSANVASVEGARILADDPALSLVADLASTMDWDAASDAGLTSSLGGADGAVNQLTVDERLELDRLLREALKKPGA